MPPESERKARRIGRPPLVLTPEQERLLNRVLMEANRLEAAKEALRRAAIEAVDAGIPLLRVAEAAGVSQKGSRTTIYRWLDEGAVTNVAKTPTADSGHLQPGAAGARKRVEL
jgi:hypothetical protein